MNNVKKYKYLQFLSRLLFALGAAGTAVSLFLMEYQIISYSMLLAAEFMVLGILLIGRSFQKEKDQIYCGLQGESRLHDLIRNLPKEYKAFYNIPLQKDGRRSEADMILVSRDGIKIVEVKNYKGKIRGDSQDPYWIQTKKVKGNLIYKKVKNPIKQIHVQCMILRKILKEHNLHFYIEGYVYFSQTDKIYTDSNEVYCSRENLLQKLQESKEKRMSKKHYSETLSAIEAITAA